MDISVRFKQLKEKKAELETRLIQVDVTYNSLSEQAQTSLKELIEKYGVKDLQEAKELLTKKSLEVNTLAEELEKDIAEFESKLGE